jgi:hypothetical protein
VPGPTTLALDDEPGARLSGLAFPQTCRFSRPDTLSFGPVLAFQWGCVPKRSGFGRNVALPKAYKELRTAVLRDRKAGKWNVQGVIATADDSETMLRHTALQARLRALV